MLWSDANNIFQPTEMGNGIEGNGGAYEEVVEEATSSAEPASTSAASASTSSAGTIASAASGSRSPLPFEVQAAASKKRPPERTNPPADTFSKNNKSANKKFEDMLVKGFSSLDKLVENSAQQQQPTTSKGPATANSKFAEYLQMELEVMPVEFQTGVRKELLLCLNEAKDKRQL